jgi:hypothetical protein
MSISPHDGATGSSGLIIPENIPGADLDPGKLEGVASTLRAAGTSALTQAQVAETSWAGLPAVLESPQGPTIYAALGTPSEVAAAIEHKFDKVSDALDDFAAALRPIKQTFADIKTDAVAFRNTITWDEKVWVSPQETKEYEGNGLAVVSSTTYSTSYSTGSSLSDVLEYLQGRGESTRTRNGRPQILAPWTESSEHIDQNNGLMDRLADAYTKLQNAEADCANAINRQRELCVADVEYIEAWQLKQSGENTVVLPWGSRVDEDRNCGESFWWGAGNAGKEALVGAAGLIGYNGTRNDWSWEQAGQSWVGAVQGLGALLVITSPPLMLLGMAGVPVLKDGVTMGQEMVKGLLAWDTWAENPSEAAGRVLVNVGSLFIPGAGEVAAAIKALSAGSRIVDLAGDAARLSEAGLAGLNKVDNLLPHLDNLVGDAVGTGSKVDDLVTVGTKIDMPDSDLLHVGTKTTDAPSIPSSFLDDSPSGPKPHTDEPSTPTTRTDDTSTPTTHTGDSATPTTHTGDSDTPTGGHGGDDTPTGGHGGGDDTTPTPTDDTPPPGSGGTEPVDPRSLDRTDPELGNNPDRSWDGKPGLHLDPDENAIVSRYADESFEIEQRVRPELERIVSDAAPDSRLVGLDEAVKFPDSLKGKVADEMLENPELTVDGALAQVKDSVRYTVESNVTDYSSTVSQTVERLRTEGYELVKFKDTWGDEGYKGINSSWVDPSTGRVIEVQFHTAESFAAKTASHDIYDQLRTPDLPADEVARLTEQTKEIFADLEIPPGAVELHDLFRIDGSDLDGFTDAGDLPSPTDPVNPGAGDGPAPESPQARIYQMMDDQPHASAFAPEQLPPSRVTDDLLTSHGTTRAEFIDIVNTPRADLTPHQLSVLDNVRGALAVFDPDTVFQKVLEQPNIREPKVGEILEHVAGPYPGSSVDGPAQLLYSQADQVILDNARTMGGSVTVVGDTSAFGTTAALHDALRLDYKDTNFKPYDSSYQVIRFRVDEPGTFTPPLSSEFGGAGSRVNDLDQRGAPFTGNGFTASLDDIVPEYMGGGRMRDGAEIWEVLEDGTQRLTAVLRNGEWIPQG